LRSTFNISVSPEIVHARNGCKKRPSRRRLPVLQQSGNAGKTQGGLRAHAQRRKLDRMRTTTLGRTGLRVSRLCLGTMNFGPETSEADSHAIMDRAREVEINFFDTANVYGGVRGAGITEQIVGRWLAQGGRREKVVLATKVYGRAGDGPNDRGLSAYHIRRACEDSLRRLQTDHIDLYQMHHVDRDTPWEEIWQAMEQLVREGKVLYVGSSNFAGWQIATANQIAARRNFLGLVSEQSKYSLQTRAIELEVVPACRAYGIGILPWSPLAGGVLGGTGSPGSRRRRDSSKALIERHRAQIEDYEKLCTKLGESPAVVALAWTLANPQVTAPIIGPRNLEQLDGCLRALDVSLDGETMRQLDEIWPGPGGEAPEAYAW
jgi:NDP-hexose C3-ketoreductase / dTDP-4-oxo-2-deoxy-alpha-D-pentos-2-ene 2,3-reductase